MTAFLTGRQRTLTFSGTTGGTWYNHKVLPAFPASGYTIASDVVIFCETFLGKFKLSFAPTTGGINCVIQCWIGSTSTTTNTFHAVTPPSITSVDCSGTWSMTADVEEVVEFNYSAYDPSIVGTQKVDPPQPLSVKFYERYKVGGNITITVSTSAGSGTITSSITTATNIIVGTAWDAYLVTSQAWCDSANGGPGNASIVTKYGGVTFGAPGATGSDTYHSWDATSGAAVTATSGMNQSFGMQVNSITAPPRGSTIQGVIRAMKDPYPASLNVKAYQYFGSPGATVAVSGGSFTNSYQQTSYFAGYLKDYQPVLSPLQYNNNPNYNDAIMANYNDESPVWAMIDPASLSSAGEDTDITRLLARGYKWNALNWSHASSVNVDNAPALGAYGAFSGTTLTNVSGGIKATVGTSPGGFLCITTLIPSARINANIKNTNWDQVDFGGYAWMRLNFTAASSCSGTIQVATTSVTKTWNVTIPTSGYIDIDLLHPDSNTATADSTDSQWPWTKSAAKYSVVDGPLGGCTNVGLVGFYPLPTAQAYTLTGISLVRKDHVKCTFLPTFKGWMQAFPDTSVGSTTTRTYYRRARLFDVDGKASREDTDSVWLQVTSSAGVTHTYSDVPISSVAYALNTAGVPPPSGYSATDLMPNPGTCTGSVQALFNCWLNSDRPSSWLYGSGYLFDGSNWVDGIEATPGTVPAQMLYDSVEDWYPGIGDVWQLIAGAYGGDLHLYMAAVLRGNSWGVLHTLTQRANGVTVTQTETSTSAAAGSGVSNTTGEYYDGARTGTGLSYGRGLTVYTTTPGTPYASITGSLYSRRKHGRRFALVSGGTPTPHHPPQEGIAVDCDLLSLHAGVMAVYSNSAGNLICNYARNGIGSWDRSTVIDSATDCAEPHIACRDWSNRIWLDYRRGGNSPTDPIIIYQAVSEDRGYTWRRIGTFTGVSGQVKHCWSRYCERTQERMQFWNDCSEVVSGTPTGRGYIWCRIFAPDETMIGDYQIGSSYSDDCSFGGDWLPNNPQCFQVVYTIGGVMTRFQSSDFGRTWLQI